MASTFHRHQFTIFATIFQLLFLVLFGIFGRYAKDALPAGSASTDFVNTNYPLFQDVHVMTLVGFGFVMVFLRRYGLAALSINLLLTAHVIQWALIIRGFFSAEFANNGHFTISVVDLITADFVVITVLISMGAVLGKLTPVQYMLMAAVEVPVAIAVEQFLFRYLKVNDVGRSMIVHVFGAYFGLALAKVFNRKEMMHHQHEGASYNSDLFAMIGTLFLWAFYPSFNAAMAVPEDARHRAIMNTYLALCSSAITTFLFSQLVDRERKHRFSMMHVGNSVLAGGIAIGTAANIVMEPVYALVVGCLAGFISVLGNHFIRPKFANALGVHDTRGVNGVHGLPGILAGIVGFVFTALYNVDAGDIKQIFPAMAKDGEGRDVFVQAGYQLAALAFVLIACIVTGAITGIILRLKCFNHIHDKEYFSDGEFIEPPEDYDFTTRIISKIDHIELTEHTALTNKDAPSPIPSATA